MSSGFFGNQQPIRFEGPESRNPLAFRYYDPGRKVLGKRMEDHFRFAVCYWHSFSWPGGDPFGGDETEPGGTKGGTEIAVGRQVDRQAERRRDRLQPVARARAAADRRHPGELRARRPQRL